MEDVIAAISTPYGRGGIAVIRISGNGALECADGFFRTASGKKLYDIEGGRTVYGNIFHSDERIDDGCVTVFRAPHSFTGEDTVEISCHGGILITQRVLESAYICGARPAQPGEFSRRAFISGKMSLTQAESVIDIIDAESDDALKIAVAMGEGILSRKIDSIREKLTALLSEVYVFIDYPDEDLTDVTPDEAIASLESAGDEIQKLISTYGTGKALSKGIDTVIFGKPNTGKSSLLNRLCGYERAIVTDIAGTTRDTVEENAKVGRVTLHLTDTAGIRESDDTVEQIGVKRAIDTLEKAELVLCVFDASRPLDDEDRAVISDIPEDKKERTVILLNKTDSETVICEKKFDGFGKILKISCKTGNGFDELTEVINSMFVDGTIDIRHDALVSNARQYASLVKANSNLESALSCLKSGASPDVAGLDIELAIGALGELDGRSVGEDIVNGIFSRFCIGK